MVKATGMRADAQARYKFFARRCARATSSDPTFISSGKLALSI
jgi:hypothetical protein